MYISKPRTISEDEAIRSLAIFTTKEARKKNVNDAMMKLIELQYPEFAEKLNAYVNQAE